MPNATKWVTFSFENKLLLRVAGVLLLFSALSIWLMVGIGSFAYPRGTFYSTGELEEDYKGDMYEVREEDLSGLNLPSWVKFERENDLLLIIGGFFVLVFGFLLINSTTNKFFRDEYEKWKQKTVRDGFDKWLANFKAEHSRDPTWDEMDDFHKSYSEFAAKIYGSKIERDSD